MRLTADVHTQGALTVLSNRTPPNSAFLPTCDHHHHDHHHRQPIDNETFSFSKIAIVIVIIKKTTTTTENYDRRLCQRCSSSHVHVSTFCLGRLSPTTSTTTANLFPIKCNYLLIDCIAFFFTNPAQCIDAVCVFSVR